MGKIQYILAIQKMYIIYEYEGGFFIERSVILHQNISDSQTCTFSQIYDQITGSNVKFTQKLKVEQLSPI